MKFGRDFAENLKRHIQSAIPETHEPLWKRVLIWGVLLGLGLAVSGVILFTLTIVVLSVGLPDVRDFDKLAGIESTIILDRDGGNLYTIHGEENRKYVPLSEISPFLQKATIDIEDDQFYEHSGFDIPGFVKAGIHEVFGIGNRRGGSTITQQLAKNAFLSSKQTYTRKLKELILSIRLERSYDKNKILELYLNRIPYGNNAYGAEMASKIYFGKSAHELTLAESVVLAGMPKAPTFYSPFGPNLYSKLDREFDATKPEALPKSILDLREEDYTTGLIGKVIELAPGHTLELPGRADIILKRMEELGSVTPEDRKVANAETRKLVFKENKTRIRAAHFVFYIRSILEEQFGKDLVAQGGLQVYTTLDPELQASAEQIVEDQIKVSKDLHGVSQAALLTLDPKTGEVLAMVGSADYFDDAARGKVNHIFARTLQPGSSFKPFVYAKAFLNRYAPATVIYDTPTHFGGGYRPQNFEGSFRGPMPIRQALAQSRNIPAIKAYFLGGQQEEIVNLVNKMGITSLDPKGNYGPPLAIGAGEATLWEMVQAFSVFANNGIKREPFSILKVVDREGDILYERKPEDAHEEEVLDPQVAYLINNILSDKSVYLGPRLDVPGHTTAAKTGTSNKEITPVKILPRDLWTMGYTPSVITGVWAGNSDGSALKVNGDGYNVAAPMWSKTMSTALKDKPNESFPVPPGITWVKVSKASGKLPNADTPENGVVSEVFASFSVPTEIDDVYKQVEVNGLDNLLPNEFTPKEQLKTRLFMNHHDPITDYGAWLFGIRDWVKGAREKNSFIADFPPTEITKMFSEDSAKKAPTIAIVSPVSFSTISGEKITVDVSVDAPYGVERVSFFLDDKETPNSVKKAKPYAGMIRLTNRIKPGKHMITARVYDKKGYVAEAKVEVQVEEGAAAEGNP